MQNPTPPDPGHEAEPARDSEPVRDLLPGAVEGLVDTDEPQNAVFASSFGWVGGMGEAVLAPGAGNLQFLGGHSVFVAEESTARIEAQFPRPKSIEGLPRVVVSARVRLRTLEGSLPSTPVPVRTTYRELTVLELYAVRPSW
jgi:hypothetical protein